MFQNTKLLVLTSFLIIFSGLGFLWRGFNKEQPAVASPAPIIQNVPEASDGERATQGLMGERAKVLEVVDGDTIKVLLDGAERTVRFVGIDTPETVDPRRPVGCFGKEASNETKSLLSGKIVILQKDVSDTDKYKRILRYIFLPLENGQILFVNDYLVREGFAKVYTYPPDVKFNEQFKDAEKQARDGKKGMWGRC